MADLDTNRRVLITICKNCQRTLAVLTDITGVMKVNFDPEGPRFVECQDCHFTHAYEASEFRWASVERLH